MRCVLSVRITTNDDEVSERSVSFASCKVCFFMVIVLVMVRTTHDRECSARAAAAVRANGRTRQRAQRSPRSARGERGKHSCLHQLRALAVQQNSNRTRTI